MPVHSVTQDPENLTLTVVGEYDVPASRLWKAWTDPRQLERFWGPPTWPATFLEHDLRVGGRAVYQMTGPEGEKAGGYWRFVAVDPGVSFELMDGFMDENGEPNAELPETRMRIEIEATPSGSRFTSFSRFPSLEALEQMVAMGMVEGITQALGQLDAVLAD